MVNETKDEFNNTVYIEGLLFNYTAEVSALDLNLPGDVIRLIPLDSGGYENSGTGKTPNLADDLPSRRGGFSLPGWVEDMIEWVAKVGAFIIETITDLTVAILSGDWGVR
ncbi:MAG: hypothetical protein ACTSR8_06965 [Promethearchaeota archaeon]